MSCRLMRCLVTLALLFVWPGCQAFHSYRPVTVQAIDAETKKPIPQAEVRISYPLAQQEWAPRVSVEATGADGVAHLQAAPYGPVGLQIATTATGYADEARAVPVPEIEAIPVAGAAGLRHPVNFVVEMYARPAPTVEFILPTGFRGVFRGRLMVRDDLVTPPGQRLFPFAVPESRVVEMLVPPLFRHTPFPEYRGRYEGGPLLSPKATLSELGFWWLKTENGYDLFLVGTEKEHTDRLAADRADGAKEGQSGGGGGHGKGRRNRGGPAAPDGGP